jgi:DNA-binding NarL/FixJ family response regulator
MVLVAMWLRNNDKDVVTAALSTGAQGCVLKTDAGTELLPAVAAVLGGNDFVSTGIKRERPCDGELVAVNLV